MLCNSNSSLRFTGISYDRNFIAENFMTNYNFYINSPDHNHGTAQRDVSTINRVNNILSVKFLTEWTILKYMMVPKYNVCGIYRG